MHTRKNVDGYRFSKSFSVFQKKKPVPNLQRCVYLSDQPRDKTIAIRAFCTRLSIAVGIAFSTLGQAAAQTDSASNNGFASPDDPSNRVDVHQELRERDSIFEPEEWHQFYKALDASRANLHEITGIKLGAFHSTLVQEASDSLPGQDTTGLATITGLYGTWDIVERGDPSAGQISIGVEARWGYDGLLTPSQLGTIGIGSATGTTDPYGATSPNVILRELFWRGGSPEQGWDYRIGKITPDRLLTGSDYIDPVSLGLPVGSQGSPSIAFPDSGLGFAVGFYPTDRFRFGVVLADANGNRANWGRIGEGNFFKAVELQAKLFPLTDKAGFSTFTVWHTDGTNDPANAGDSSTGEAGWGYFVKFEQELSKTGKDIGMIRFGQSFDGAAVYKQQGSIRYVRVDPPDPFGLKDDRFGIAASYVSPLANPFDRNEWGIDTFYKFNLLERVETTFAYQYIRNPTFNTFDDDVHVFSFRLSQFF